MTVYFNPGLTFLRISFYICNLIFCDSASVTISTPRLLFKRSLDGFLVYRVINVVCLLESCPSVRIFYRIVRSFYHIVHE